MALAASFFGMLLAVPPLGICGASNLVPQTGLPRRTHDYHPVTRTFHEIIVAILFVKIFGFGPWPAC